MMLIQFKILLAIILMAATSCATWYVASDHFNNKAAQLKIKQDKEIIAANASNDALKNKLEVEHEQANNAIDSLLGNDKPVRLQIARCPNIVQANTTPGGELQNSDANRAIAALEVALADFREQTKQDAAEWGRGFATCQVIKEWGETFAK
jgi:hypothetical protein